MWCLPNSVVGLIEAWSLVPFFGCGAMLWNWRLVPFAWVGFHFILNEIKSLSPSIQLEFIHILRSADAMADALAKQGVDRISPFVVLHMKLFSIAIGIALVY